MNNIQQRTRDNDGRIKYEIEDWLKYQFVGGRGLPMVPQTGEYSKVNIIGLPP